LLVARRRDRLEALTEQLHSEAGIQAEVVCADLTNPKAIGEVKAPGADDGALTSWSTMRGFGGYQPFASIAPKVIDDLIAIHTRASVQWIRWNICW
jgi:uncharacterized protein